MQAIAINWYLLQATNNPMSIGFAIAISYLPGLILSPFAGIFSDRRDSLFITVATDFMRAFMVVLIALYFVSETRNTAPIYILLVLLATGEVLFAPASQTLIRESYISASHAVNVLAKVASINIMFNIIGSGIGGWFISIFTPGVCLALNAASFCIAAICNCFIIRISKKGVVSKDPSYLSSFNEGWEFIRGKSGMLELLLLTIVGSACYRMIVTVLAPFIQDTFKGSSVEYAYANMVFTAGGVIAGFVVMKGLESFRHTLFRITFFGMAMSLLGISLTSSYSYTLFLLFCLGLSTTLNLAAIHALLNINSPKEMLGRVIGLRSIMASATKIVSALLSGYAASTISLRIIFGGFGVLVLILSFTSSRLYKIPIPISMKSTK